MAEFQETMAHWRRICKAHESCVSCLLYGCCAFGPDSLTDAEIATLEELIMQWAEENPEQVYPTWYDWLDLMSLYPGDPIPANIAQKLGLELRKLNGES